MSTLRSESLSSLQQRAQTRRLRAQTSGEPYPMSRPIESIRWVAKVLALADIQATDAPSSEAWALYQSVKGDAKREWWFWRQLWAKCVAANACRAGFQARLVRLRNVKGLP